MSFRSYILVPSILIGTVISGCVPMAEHAPERGDLFAPLHRANLAGMEHRIALDLHTGREDAWTELAQAFVDLASCHEISPPSSTIEDHPTAHLLYELVRLEDQRRLRLIHLAIEASGGTWHQGTIHTRFTSRTFFARGPEDIDEDLIHWPAGFETWPDEWPAPGSVGFECDGLDERKAPGTFAEPFNDIDPNGPTGQMIVEWYLARTALQLARRDDDSEAHRRAVNTLTAHRADLALTLRQREDIQEFAADAVDRFSHFALNDLLAVTVDAEDDDEDANSDHLGHALRIAWLAMALDETSIAIDALQRLSTHPIDGVADVARYYVAKLAWQKGWWDIAGSSILLGEPQSLRSAHAYFSATALRFSGRDDAFLGTAREALRDRRRNPEHPFLGALYREVLRELAGYDIDDRTDELLEEMGPRWELSERKREFAEVALDVGRAEVAAEVIEELINDTDDARRLPRLYAIRALSAFMLDDRSTFDRMLGNLTDRPEGLREAIPRSRRAAFFAHRDTEVARVLRAMLPVMAEWGDDNTARAMRQDWLETIVEHTQRFLRWAPESIVSQNLTDLYKLAGKLLDDHPRGYAERVGSQDPSTSPLVLGTVDMPPSPPLDEAPSPQLRWPQLPSLLLIPVGTPPTSFTDDIEMPAAEEESS